MTEQMEDTFHYLYTEGELDLSTIIEQLAIRIIQKACVENNETEGL
ncbi:hypothetical protein ACFSTH_14260 [Paenibacillus yanchengensis]|uniref:Uncharacterized protein n=1 Tax=Paenibacillus yanchengensis TaxID=2035833 RepID=A0ABW4YQE9_9BACL